MQYATLRLSKDKDHTQYFDLKFQLIKNNFTQKWIDCVLEAQQQQYPISETWAIYNINKDMNGDFIKQNLNRLIAEVDKIQELFGFSLDNINNKDLLNRIHAVFEKNHGQLDDWLHNPLFKNKPDSFRKNLSEINQFVHACETLNGTPKIRVVWFDLPKHKKFTDDDYKLFTSKKNFGSLYSLYCDVGKNIESLAVDNDDHHHDMVPNIHFSADCVAFFGENSLEEVKQLEQDIDKFKKENREYITSQGYELDDLRLTPGRIELGKLQTELSKEQLLQEMKKYNNIQSFYLQ